MIFPNQGLQQRDQLVALALDCALRHITLDLVLNAIG